MLLELKNVTAGYDGTPIIHNIDFTVSSGDFIGIIGPNGGGKTTLLKVILGIIKPYKGTVKLNSQLANLQTKKIGYLPQYNNFDRKFPITVRDIVLSGFITRSGLLKQYSAQEKARANLLMEEMGIDKLKNISASELSGGQVQRALLCRALASDPEMIILDEPNTYVDNQFEHELYKKLKQLNQKGKAILLVTHDVGTVSYYIKGIACVNETLVYHPSNIITEQQMAAYNCPLQLITHGDVPHTVLKKHDHNHG